VSAATRWCQGFAHLIRELARFAVLAGVGLATGFRFWSYRRYVWPTRSGNGGNVGDVGLAARPECDRLTGGHDEALAHAR